MLQLLVQEAHFEHVVDARLELDQVKRFGNEIPRARRQGTHLLVALGGDHQDRQVPVTLHLLQRLHHLKTIHAGHMQVKQNQIVGVCTMQVTHGKRVLGGCEAGVAGIFEQLHQQCHVDRMVVHNQDPRCQNVTGVDHFGGRGQCVAA